ncbi:MAG: hypothetical protein ACXACR_13360, partial [Candidatus Hodarchaeales archaeon]
MCRLLALWTKPEKKTYNRHLLNDWFTAWFKSAKYDHYLEKIYRMPKSRSNHKDGWGVVTIGLNSDQNLNWLNKTLNLEPVFSYKRNLLARSILGSPFLRLTNQMLLAHARRASIGMPVTQQQVQPLEMYDDKNSLRIYLIHNGKVNSNVLNKELSKEFQLKSTNVSHFSDTQVLIWYLFQKLREFVTISTNYDLKDFWIEVLREIIDFHEDKNQDYKMQLIIAPILNDVPQLISCSALNAASLKTMPYYQLFTGSQN